MAAPSPQRNRREILADAAVLGTSTLLAHGGLFAQAPVAIPRGEKVRTIHFRGNRRYLERVINKGWHGRYFHDLASLGPKTLITPNERFYIRTRCSEKIGDTGKWEIALRNGDATTRLAASTLQERAKPMGVHCLECSGNGGAFGMLSAARWDGVPLLDVLEEHGLRGQHILVDGFDDDPNLSPRALQQGCSWIFKRGDLKRAGAFLATRMNGAPLPRDHGFPVRLYVPGWYGCTCVKWVQSIEVVDADAPPTKHMREYASRTHQRGIPELARKYRPAEMDTAALPIRVEEWRDAGRSVYKILGLVWGGSRPVAGLQLHISGEKPVAVSDFVQKTHKTWSLWSHDWEPTRKGRFRMWLTVPDKTVRTRRLDTRYYERRIEI